MRLVADEGCDAAVIRALRGTGHNVRAIAEESPGLPDDDVLAIAVGDGRTVVTEDTDFGYLVYAAGAPSVGVILLRFPERARGAMAGSVVALLDQVRDSLAGAFVVVQPGRSRISRPPTP